MSRSTGQPDTGTPSAPSSCAANAKRRRFLFTLGAGGAGAAVAAVVASPAAAVVAPAAEPVSAGKGYQETQHVRNYYRTARI